MSEKFTVAGAHSNVHPQLVIERFLLAAREPVLFEPGEDPLPIRADSFLVARHGAGTKLECWNDKRNLVRLVRAVKLDRPGRVELEVERFGGRVGALSLVDLADPHNRDAGRRGARLKYRERFRRSLQRQFPDWRIAELSTDADLHHSLSPSFPRALLRKGPAGFAAIGAAEDALDPGGALSFGLIWLNYLRQREQRASVEGLVLFLPAGKEHTTCHRVRHLDLRAARYAVFVHTPDGHEAAVDPRDYTNFDTRLDPFLQPLAEAHAELGEWVARLAAAPHVQRRDHPDGSASLAVRGLEFARAQRELRFGIDRKHVAGGERHLEEIAALADELARLRGADAEDRLNPLYTRDPESWLESQVRASLGRIDAMLLTSPLHGQAPQFAGGERGLVDLLAVDRAGRLAVIEIKATEDIHLPLQALDYWMRVKWHLDRGEFAGRGYFPGLELSAEAPRLLMIAPALEYHPTNEIVLRFFANEVKVERYGVGIDWRRELRVMFHRTNAFGATAPLTGRG